MLKFENVDIIKFLKAIMQINTKYFQSDFDMDIKTLTQAVKKQNPEDKRYLWMSRPEGTWCLKEMDTFIRGKLYRHIKNVSVERGNTKLIYENGNRMQAAEKCITGNDDPDLGKFLSFEDQPKDLDALCSVLQGEKRYRDRFKCGDIKAYIRAMSA